MSSTTLELKPQFVTKVNTFLKRNFNNASLKNKDAVSKIIIPVLTSALSAHGEEHGENVLYYAFERAIMNSPVTKENLVKIPNNVLSESLAIMSKTKVFKEQTNTSSRKPGTGLGYGGPMTNTAFSFTKTPINDRFISNKQVYLDSFKAYMTSLKESQNVKIDKKSMAELYTEANEQVLNNGIKHAETFLKNAIIGAKANAKSSLLTNKDIEVGLDHADTKYKEYKKAKKEQTKA